MHSAKRMASVANPSRTLFSPLPVNYVTLKSPPLLAKAPLDRCNNLKKDVEHLQQLECSPIAKFVTYQRLQVLIDPVTQRPRFLQQEHMQKLKQSIVQRVFLGLDTRTGSPHFAVDVTPETKLSDYGKLSDVRNALYTAEEDEAAIIGQGRSILEFHHNNKFCSVCGHQTRSAEAGGKRICGPHGAIRPDRNATVITPAGERNPQPCTRSIYPRTDPVAITLTISADGKMVLLGRKSTFPAGVYTCLAGFVDVSESIDESARREVVEESGVKISEVRYIASQPWPTLGGQLMLGFHAVAEATGREHEGIYPAIILDDDELESARWFDRPTVLSMIHESVEHQDWTRPPASSVDKPVLPSLRIPPAFSIAHQLIALWANEYPDTLSTTTTTTASSSSSFPDDSQLQKSPL